MLLSYYFFQDEWSQDLCFVSVSQGVQRFDPSRLGRETSIIVQRPLTHIDSFMERLRLYLAFLQTEFAIIVQVTPSSQLLAVLQTYNTFSNTISNTLCNAHAQATSVSRRPER